MKEYYFSRKLKEIDEMRARGINVINLGIGSPDLPPAENVIETLHACALKSNTHGYQSYNGIPALRNAFAGWYKRWFGVGLNPDNEILPLIGSKEGIMHISMAFINQGDEILVPDPGYPAYEAAAKLAGGSVRYYDLTEETGWLPDLDKLESEGLEKVKLMWINYPHMPTGKKATRELFVRLIDLARKYRFLLCNDNQYSFILNEEHLSLLSVPGSKDVAIELNSLSKSHNMAGWRIGMAAGNPEYIQAIIKVKSNMDSGMFQPLQAAAAEALKAEDSWYSDLNKIYRKRRAIAEEILSSMSCSFDPAQTGLFLWGKIPDGCQSSEELTDRILSDSHVFITPGFIFGSNGRNHVRISLCANENVLADARDRIKNSINKQIL